MPQEKISQESLSSVEAEFLAGLDLQPNQETYYTPIGSDSVSLLISLAEKGYLKIVKEPTGADQHYILTK